MEKGNLGDVMEKHEDEAPASTDRGVITDCKESLSDILREVVITTEYVQADPRSYVLATSPVRHEVVHVFLDSNIRLIQAHIKAARAFNALIGWDECAVSLVGGMLSENFMIWVPEDGPKT